MVMRKVAGCSSGWQGHGCHFHDALLFIWPDGQAVKTSPFHGGNPGSIPGRVTRKPADAFASAGFPFVPGQGKGKIRTMAGGSGFVLGRFGRAQVCKTGASKGKTEVQAGQCSRCSGPLAGPVCSWKNTRRPAQRKNACQKPAAVLCSKRKRRKGKVRQECAFAENFTQTCFYAVGV